MRPPTSNWPGGKDEPNTVLCGNRNVPLEFFYSSVAHKFIWFVISGSHVPHCIEFAADRIFTVQRHTSHIISSGLRVWYA